ncbi:MDR family MFS transporter [Demequina sp. NBRC 110057]|uniref:MDR family MFS transporter n=1 Tax=Demequina sp. NBRC 110057 TaxID=1570346 RepID=UPI000A02F9EA|nr:MDR family MFS transporter [Demequina sp. NBRC 110057]
MTTTDQRGAAAAPPRSEKSTIVLLFSGLMVTMLMASISQTILSTALPTIVGELGGVDQMTWVITGYVLASTVMMPVYGRISDLFGRKPVLLAAISLFIAGSIVGGLAQGMGMLVAARVLQGLGGGGLMILSQSAIADVVPARDRGKYMGIMGAVFAVSSVAGPLVGGWLTEGPGWRWAFWLNIPLGILSLLATVLLLRLPKVEREGKPRIDYLGMALIAGATIATVLVCTWGGGEYAWGSWQILGLIALAVALAGAFIGVERRAAQPVLPLDLFKNRNFTMATLAGLFIGIAMFGVVSYMPTYIQMVTGVDATEAGMLMVPMMGGLLAASIISGQLVSRTGRYKIYPLVGSIIMAAGLFLTSTLSIDSPTWLLCTYIAIFGIGIGLGQQILVLIVQDAFPATIVGTATAGFNYFKQVGATVGSAVVGTVFATHLADRLTVHLAQADGGGAAVDTHALTPAAVAQLPDGLRIPILESYNEALLPILLWLVPVAIFAAVATYFVKEKVLSTRVEHQVADEALAEGELLVMVDPDDAGNAIPVGADAHERR